MPPLLLNWQKVPTSKFPAMVVLKTSTCKISAIISSVSLSISVCTRATWSLQTMTFPRAESLSSTLFILTYSGIELRMFRNSKSLQVAGTSNPFLLPLINKSKKEQKYFIRFLNIIKKQKCKIKAPVLIFKQGQVF